MNSHFQALLCDDAPSEVAAFIRSAPGQLDTDDIRAALAAAFEQIAEIKDLIRDVQHMR